jgi:hypothetical protein
VCHVSAVSRGRSPGNCFPQLGPLLFAITGEVVTSFSRSSPILVGWWSAQCNDFTKVLIAAGEARQRHQQCKGQHTERDYRSGSDGFSEVFSRIHRKLLYPKPKPFRTLLCITWRALSTSSGARKRVLRTIYMCAPPPGLLYMGRWACTRLVKFLLLLFSTPG